MRPTAAWERVLGRFSRRPVATTAGRTDADDVAGLQLDGHLVEKRCGARLVAAGQQPVLADCAGLAAVDTPRAGLPPLSDERQRRDLAHLQLALDAVAARERARAATAAPQRESAYPQWKRPLERFDRRVARVRHRRVHAAHPGAAGPPALPAANGLVVHPPRVAEQHVVHRPLAGGTEP